MSDKKSTKNDIIQRNKQTIDTIKNKQQNKQEVYEQEAWQLATSLGSTPAEEFCNNKRS